MAIKKQHQSTTKSDPINMITFQGVAPHYFELTLPFHKQVKLSDIL